MLLIDEYYDHVLYRVYHIMEHQDLHKYVLLLNATNIKETKKTINNKNELFTIISNFE